MRQADLTRERLVRAGLDLFSTRGYHPTTTAQIAKRAGVAEGNLYRHFNSKQHLWNELYRGAVQWAVRVVDETKAPTARERLAAVARALVSGAEREPGAARVCFLLPTADLPDAGSRDAAGRLAHAFETLVAQGKAEGTVRTGSAEVLAAAWLGVIKVAIAQVCAGAWTPAQPAVSQLIDSAWGAIAAT